MTPRILIVDDDESVMLTMQAVLEMDGYTVTEESGKPFSRAPSRTRTGGGCRRPRR